MHPEFNFHVRRSREETTMLHCPRDTYGWNAGIIYCRNIYLSARMWGDSCSASTVYIRTHFDHTGSTNGNGLDSNWIRIAFSCHILNRIWIQIWIWMWNWIWMYLLYHYIKFEYEYGYPYCSLNKYACRIIWISPGRFYPIFALLSNGNWWRQCSYIRWRIVAAKFAAIHMSLYALL